MLRILSRTSKRNPFFTFRGYSRDDKIPPTDPTAQNADDKKHLRLENSLPFIHMRAPQKHDFTISVKEWLNYKHRLIVMANQQYDPTVHREMGSDLAVAKFVIDHGGRVQFRDSSDWITKKKGGQDLPKKFDPNYILEAIDLSGINIYYDSLLNLYGCVNIKWLSMRGSKILDDWGLDRLSGEYPFLEYLDISECKNVSEKGLESLYRLLSLKKLIVTNHHSTIAFEWTCVQLEDCTPGLVCEVISLQRDHEN